MPELPEVQTVLDTLMLSLAQEKILSLDLSYPALLEKDSEFPLDKLLGHRFVAFSRRGKYLCFEMDGGFYWILHLRMEGKFHLYREDTTRTRHTHLVIETEHNWVHYLDTRKFSRMTLVSDKDAYFARKKLGLEALSPELNGNYLYQHFKKSSSKIKTLLLDQRILAGLGNIYADEVLYAAEIHPLTPGNRLSRKDCERLALAIEPILSQALAAGGTTIRSYTSSLNVTGRFAYSLKAYGQAGKPCLRCACIMERIKVNGRSSTYCPSCQKVKA